MQRSKNKVSIGNCGEYFVAAELERHGFSVAVPMSNTELFDILVFNRESHNQYAIQVKTTSGSKPKWLLRKKNEGIEAENIVYVFVILNGNATPKYYIVPSKKVAQYIRETHNHWLETPARNGKQHNDNNMRVFEDEKNQYLDKWNYLA